MACVNCREYVTKHIERLSKSEGMSGMKEEVNRLTARVDRVKQQHFRDIKFVNPFAFQ